MAQRTRLLMASAAFLFVPSLASAQETQNYTYDALGRLVSVESDGTVNDGVAKTLCYDDAGNRTTFKSSLTSETAICLDVGNGSLGTGVSFAINDKTATEGSSLVFTVTKTGAATGTLTLDYATATGTASASDFTGSSGTLSFGIADTTKTITIASTQDANDEVNETFTVNLSNPLGASTISDGQGVGTINDDDPLGAGVTFAINDKAGTEGSSLVFTVTKTGSAGGSLTVNYATANGTAGAADYTATSGVLSFGTTETSKTVTVASTQDAIDENNETFTVNLSVPQGAATISDGQGVGTINDDDPLGAGSSFAINDVSVTEGGNLVFTVTKAGTALGALTVNYATANGTAGASDFTAASGTLSFGTSETTKTITIASTQDTIDEPNETFTVNLSSPQGAATISDAQGVGTINDDDEPLGTGVSFAINDKAATEGTNLVFTVTKTGTATGSLTVNYATANGTAGSADYTGSSGTLTFGTAETTKTITIASTQDAIDENNETFNVNLSNAQGAATISDAQGVGTINDDDPLGAGTSFAIGDSSVTEGGNLVFTVTKSGTALGALTINYATANGTASSTDYTATSGTLSFATGDTTKTITVATTSDVDLEGDETLFVNLSTPQGASTISDAQAVGTIIDDDDEPAYCVSKPWLCE